MTTHLAHRQVAYSLLKGHGLEIGAFHQPAEIPKHCTIEYCDAHSKEDASQLFPELDINLLVEVNYICDLDKQGLSLFENARFDFVILNHVIEHVANPIKVIEELFRIAKISGKVVISAPDKEFTVDKTRALTSFEHLRKEYENNVDYVTDEHYIDFLRVMRPDLLEPKVNLPIHINNVRKRREHAHIWTSQTFSQFMQDTLKLLQIRANPIFISLSEENKSEYFSVWEKL